MWTCLHTSYGRARHQIRDWSESGRSRDLLTPGTSDSCRPRGVVTRDFSAIFDRLFDRLPFEFRPLTFTIGFYGKKSFISELKILDLPVITLGFGPSRGKLCLVVICQPGTLVNSTGHSQKRQPGWCIQSFGPHHPPNTPMLYPNISFADTPPQKKRKF